MIVLLNNSSKTQTVTLPLNIQADYTDVLNANAQFSTRDGTLLLETPGKSGRVLVRNPE